MMNIIMIVDDIHVIGGISVFMASFSMSDLTDSDMKNVINVLEADIPDSINVSNQSFIF